MTDRPITCPVCAGSGHAPPRGTVRARNQDDGDPRVYIVTDWLALIVCVALIFALGRCTS